MNLTKDEQYILYDWIDRYVLPSKNMNYDASTDPECRIIHTLGCIDAEHQIPVDDILAELGID